MGSELYWSAREIKRPIDRVLGQGGSESPLPVPGARFVSVYDAWVSGDPRSRINRFEVREFNNAER